MLLDISDKKAENRETVERDRLNHGAAGEEMRFCRLFIQRIPAGCRTEVFRSGRPSTPDVQRREALRLQIEV